MCVLDLKTLISLQGIAKNKMQNFTYYVLPKWLGVEIRV